MNNNCNFSDLVQAFSYVEMYATDLVFRLYMQGSTLYQVSLNMCDFKCDFKCLPFGFTLNFKWPFGHQGLVLFVHVSTIKGVLVYDLKYSEIEISSLY